MTQTIFPRALRSARPFVLATLVLSVSAACQTGSIIEVPSTKPAVSYPFTMIIASDSQYPWWGQRPCSGCDAADCAAGRCDADVCAGRAGAAEACVKRMATQSITDQIKAASGLPGMRWPSTMGGAPIATPTGLIVNGDLTAYNHSQEVSEEDQLVARALREVQQKDGSNPIPKLVPFLGLGNHDYRNNVCDCRSYPPYDYNICARMAAHNMYGLYSNRSWIAFDACSLAYAWTFQKTRFIQMHLYPGYKADFEYWLTDNEACKKASRRFDPEPRPPEQCNDSVVYPSFAFLERMLREADASGERSVLLFHDPEEYWSNGDLTRFNDLVKQHDVLAVFAGHYHSTWGVRPDVAVARGLVNRRGATVPVLLSGASEMQTFIVAEFRSDAMLAAVMGTAGGTPVFLAPTTSNPTPQISVRW